MNQVTGGADALPASKRTGGSPFHCPADDRAPGPGPIGGAIPSSPAVSARMSRTRRHGTAAELAVRSELHRRGFRYRVQRPLEFDARRKADILFPRERVAVFVDGCFWHSCPEHATHPKANAQFWAEKLARNRTRDGDTNRRLEDAGWTVVRVWEHEPASRAVDLIAAKVAERRAEGR
jgi:DNA mismatch endonuclease (patch repair protein)